MVPDEENDRSRLTQESGDWQSRCEVPREKETQNSVVSVKIVCSAENVLYRGQERDRVPEGSTMLQGRDHAAWTKGGNCKGKEGQFHSVMKEQPLC